MNIAMIVHQDYFTDGRVKRYAESLVERGHSVDVLCVRSEKSVDAVPPDGIRVFQIPLSRHYSGLTSYVIEYGIGFLIYAVMLLYLSLRRHYQVVHVHNMPDFLVFATIPQRLMGARIVLDIHDPMPEFFMSKYDKDASSLMVRMLRLQEQLSTHYANFVITANNNFKEKVSERGTPVDRIITVHNLPDPHFFADAHQLIQHRDDERFTLIYPGTIAARYGLDLPIRALPQLRQSIPEIRVRYLGRTVAYVDELKALASELGVSDQVEFMPPVAVEKVPYYIATAHVGIYPALPDPHMDIALPSKVLEYAVVGIPIVASRLSVLESFFADSGILFFEPGDTNGFISLIEQLYASKSLCDSLVAKTNRAVVSKYTWPGEFEPYAQAIEWQSSSPVVESQKY